ncbi:MAG: glycosyltransferase family 39 protein [Planctomycetota bacterium]
MAILLVPICTVLMYRLIRAIRASQGGALCWRTTVLYTILFQGAFVTAGTEVLSLFHAINFFAILIVWLTLAMFLFVWLKRVKEPPFASIRALLNGLEAGEKALLLGILLLAAVTFTTAIVAPPNNGDSMTYHMARVAQWVQNATLDYFPTYEFRQNELQPLAEYFILHWQILSGTDRFANLVQWFSLIGSLAAVSLLARELGTGRRGEFYAAVFALTMPMTVLQASSTQNDLVAAFGLVCVMVFGLRFARHPTWGSVLAWGMSFGFAALVKGTSWIYAFPFGLYYLGKKVWAGHPRTLAFASLLAAVILAFNAGYFARNIEYCGHPMGSPKLRSYVINTYLDPKIALSNAVRNLALQVPVPEKAAGHLENLMRRFHRLIRLDMNDPDSSFRVHLLLGMSTRNPYATHPFRWPLLNHKQVHEDSAGNPLHLFLILISLGYALFAKGQPNGHDRRALAGCIVFAFLLVSLFLRWQPWNARLELPLFLAFAPLSGCMLGEFRWKRTALTVAFVLLLAAFYPALANYRRPILSAQNVFNTSRYSLYFYKAREQLKDEYVKIRDFIQTNHFQKIGLITFYDNYEYPLWVLLKPIDPANMEIHHAYFKDEYTRNTNFIYYGGKAGWKPDAVISLGLIDYKNIRVEGHLYTPALNLGRMQVFVPFEKKKEAVIK